MNRGVKHWVVYFGRTFGSSFSRVTVCSSAFLVNYVSSLPILERVNAVTKAARH